MSGAAFWRRKRVFLTGHTGFKGSWLALLLAGWGAELHGFALPPSEGSIYGLAQVDAAMASSTMGDVRSLDETTNALARSGAEIVFHLAAQPLVRASYVAPVDTYATNVMGTVHLLEAVRRTPSVKAVVVVTTDKCYENREWVWGYREGEPMGGHDPYSSSKGCAELVTGAYRRSFFAVDGARIATARAGNVIGGGDVSPDRLVPDLVRALACGDRPLIRNPGALRPWQHVLEPLAGYITLAERLYGKDGERFAQPWNFGPDGSGERSVADVVEAVCQAWGDGAGWDRDHAGHVHEATFLKLDSSKAHASLDWRPRWDFDRTVDETIGWYRAAQHQDDMGSVTRQQIDAYLGDVA